MSINKFSVKLLGTRGSFPVTDINYDTYGRDTMCLLVRYSDKYLLLDAGTGITKSEKYIEKSKNPIPVLLSHSHLDHIMGIIKWSNIFSEDAKIQIYSVPREGHSCKEQIALLFTKPLWPISISNLASDIKFIDIETPSFKIDDVDIDWIESNHPGGSSIYKINFEGKQLVYATDFEHSKESVIELEKFVRDVDILFYDGNFTVEEYKKSIGWGHSTWREGIEIACRSNVSKIVIIHHNPNSDDIAMEMLQQEIDSFRLENLEKGLIYPICVLGKAEEEFIL